jgi:hypothetical protein
MMENIEGVLILFVCRLKKLVSHTQPHILGFKFVSHTQPHTNIKTLL